MGEKDKKKKKKEVSGVAGTEEKKKKKKKKISVSENSKAGDFNLKMLACTNHPHWFSTKID